MTKLMVLVVVSVLLLANVKPGTGVVFPPMCWTDWFNRYIPDVGDWEDLRDLRAENPDRICLNPTQIQAVTVVGNIPAEDTGQKFYVYSASQGLICRNTDQKDGVCDDYKVRFRCPCLW